MATTRAKVAAPKRGEVYLVALDPTIGSEIKKTRPALILQNDISNLHGSTTIVAPLTSSFDPKHLYPTEVLVRAPEGGLKVVSVIQLNQVRAVDRRRLVKRIGAVTPETMHQAERALVIATGLKDLAVLHSYLHEAGLGVDELLKGL